MSGQKQLAAILHADIAGFASLIHASPTMVEKVRRRHQETFAKHFKSHHGLHLQHFGDQTIAVFASAGSAVECAIDIQHDLMCHPEIPVRMAVHSGEIILDDLGIYGAGVKIASGMERIAVPGSVLISDKVQDDLRNHPWIQTDYLDQELIPDTWTEMDIYAVVNRGINIPQRRPRNRNSVEHYERELPPQFEEQSRHEEGKNKFVAALLSFLFGMLGVHRFYLGQKLKGVLYMLAFAFTFMLSFEEDAPLVLFSLIIPWIDAVLFLAMPRSEFHEKYNAGKRFQKRKRRSSLFRRSKNPTYGLLKKALRKIEAGQYRSAIEVLDDLLDTDPTNHVAHYYLARCFSQLGDERQSLLHLDQAIEFGYEDFDHIEEDYALVHLRNCANFQAFRANDYQIPEHLPPPQNDLLSNRQTRSDASEKSNFPNYQMDRSISSVGVYERQNRG